MVAKVDMYRRLKGSGGDVNRALAKSVVVQEALLSHAFRIGAIAEENLIKRRYSGDAKIEITDETTANNPDVYVWLNDKAGDEAAMSVEFGREGYIDPDTGERYGQMDGLFVLTDAANLHRMLALRVPVKRARRGGKPSKREQFWPAKGSSKARRRRRRGGGV